VCVEGVGYVCVYVVYVCICVCIYEFVKGGNSEGSVPDDKSKAR